jgi:hypothetical protein
VLIHCQDFIPKLKDHLLPRIKALLSEEASTANGIPSRPFNYGLADPLFTEQHETIQTACNSVLFKHDRIYRHHLARFNYTTYDVRRSQDMVNPNTSHCDIMLLANPEDLEGNANHRFLYARVLGIFHANVIYTGTGMLDYSPRKLEFLWVRWFQYDGSHSVVWEDRRLDCVRFPPMASEGAFGFVDPRDVLRGCHVMPRFAQGRLHIDGVGLSRCAADSNDWLYYYIDRSDNGLILYSQALNCFLSCRFVDRDMTMRYHWGLAVGHTYTHGEAASTVSPSNQSTECDMELEVTPVVPENVDPAADNSQAFNEEGSDIEQREQSQADWEDADDLSDEYAEGECEEFSDDEMVLAMDDMYGVGSCD